MKIKFEFIDHTFWEGDPGDAANSPDIGVIRMWGIDDFGREVLFVYDDFYYIIPLASGRFRVGSGTNRREFTLEPGRDGAIAQERFTLSANAILRLGQQVSQEEAINFGLIDEGGKLLSEKSTVIIEIGNG